MKSLTLHQPHTHSVAHLGKRIENRNWTPPAHLVGEVIAIHAGKKLDLEALEDLQQRGYEIPDELPAKAVVAVARLVSVVEVAPPESHPQRQWWIGPYGWILDDVVALPSPVPCRGYQRLWNLPSDVAEAVYEQWGKAEVAA